MQCRLDAPCHEIFAQSVAAWRLSLQSSASLRIYKMDWLASYHMDKCFHRNCPINTETYDTHIDRIHHDHIPLDARELLPIDSGQVDGN